MNVASKELCRELHELSGWDDTSNTWKRLRNSNSLKWNDWYSASYNNGVWNELGEQSLPAYDLGYLLRKLPARIQGGSYLSMAMIDASNGDYCFGYFAYGEPEHFVKYADTPEDTACSLAIELFKQGILTREDQS